MSSIDKTKRRRTGVCKAALSSLAGFRWHRVISWWMALHRWKWKDVHRCHTALGGQPPVSRVNNASGQYI
ncbi:hypothetical protein ACIQ7Q_30120 [Streptomyces sp. NPDC096176]|uniref:hypothetical protein n=1 Tax=Streptomyces sp. NPDC096176 TaxID=3366079 RepID=UPI00383019AD